MRYFFISIALCIEFSISLLSAECDTCPIGFTYPGNEIIDSVLIQNRQNSDIEILLFLNSNHENIQTNFHKAFMYNSSIVFYLSIKDSILQSIVLTDSAIYEQLDSRQIVPSFDIRSTEYTDDEFCIRDNYDLSNAITIGYNDIDVVLIRDSLVRGYSLKHNFDGYYCDRNDRLRNRIDLYNDLVKIIRSVLDKYKFIRKYSLNEKVK